MPYKESSRHGGPANNIRAEDRAPMELGRAVDSCEADCVQHELEIDNISSIEDLFQIMSKAVDTRLASLVIGDKITAPLDSAVKEIGASGLGQGIVIFDRLLQCSAKLIGIHLELWPANGRQGSRRVD